MWLAVYDFLVDLALRFNWLFMASLLTCHWNLIGCLWLPCWPSTEIWLVVYDFLVDLALRFDWLFMTSLLTCRWGLIGCLWLPCYLAQRFDWLFQSSLLTNGTETAMEQEDTEQDSADEETENKIQTLWVKFVTFLFKSPLPPLVSKFHHVSLHMTPPPPPLVNKVCHVSLHMTPPPPLLVSKVCHVSLHITPPPPPLVSKVCHVSWHDPSPTYGLCCLDFWVHCLNG